MMRCGGQCAGGEGSLLDGRARLPFRAYPVANASRWCDRNARGQPVQSRRVRPVLSAPHLGGRRIPFPARHSSRERVRAGPVAEPAFGSAFRPPSSGGPWRSADRDHAPRPAGCGTRDETVRSSHDFPAGVHVRGEAGSRTVSAKGQELPRSVAGEAARCEMPGAGAAGSHGRGAMG